MMRNLKYIIFLMLLSTSVFSQDSLSVYNPKADAKAEINFAISKAEKENKHILLMIGGNWCRWCKMFDQLLKDSVAVDSALNSNFIFQHVNFSKENKNLELMKLYDFPQRFGFPVFVVLNSKGERIHTQNSEYLEQDKSYSVKKVIEFFGQWGPSVLSPDLYK